MSVYPHWSRTTAPHLFLISAHSTQNIHPILIESLDITLVEVHDVELDDSAALCVRMPVSLLDVALPGATDLEVEPERAPLGIGVHLHQQVVLIFVDHVGRVEVSTFEVRIER